MTRTRPLHRWTFAALLAAVLTLTLAQVAAADPGWRRWKHDDRGRDGRHERVMVYRDRDRGAGPVLAGLIGGFVLGAMTHPQPVVVHERVYVPAPPRYVDEQGYAPPPPRYSDERPSAPAPAPRYSDERPSAPPQAPDYRYEDSNGERWWDTFGECSQAANDRDGPRVIRVVDARTNRCVDTLYWKHDHFISDDDRNYDDRGNYRYDDERDGR